MLIEAVQLNIVAIAYLCTMFVFFGVCTFLVAFIADLRQQFELFDGKIRIHEHSATAVSAAAKFELRRLFVDIVEFHCDIKQLSALTNHNQ